MDFAVKVTQEAAPWSLFAGQFGKGAIWVAFGLFIMSALAWLGSKNRFSKPGAITFVLGGIALFAAFGALAVLFVKDQFQYEYVRAHGDVLTDLKYKISGIWSGQQGSFLLWACASAAWTIFAARVFGNYRRWFTIASATFLAGLSAILAFETPFNVTMAHGKVMIPPTGAGLTPALQNYWNVSHPCTSPVLRW